MKPTLSDKERLALAIIARDGIIYAWDARTLPQIGDAMVTNLLRRRLLKYDGNDGEPNYRPKIAITESGRAAILEAK